VIGTDIDLSVTADERSLTVSIDPGQFEQIVLNLAANARDAMPQGGALRVETRAHVVTEREARRHPGLTAGPKVRFSMADTGIGVPDDIKARIFEPFFTTKALGAGTGLGLAMCYGIVKQAGGYIGVDSQPGKGATFWICLPQVHGRWRLNRPRCRRRPVGPMRASCWWRMSRAWRNSRAVPCRWAVTRCRWRAAAPTPWRRSTRCRTRRTSC